MKNQGNWGHLPFASTQGSVANLEKMKLINDILSPHELIDFFPPSTLRGCLAVGFTWSVIFLCIFLSAHFPHPLILIPCWILVGGRQLALAILMHETSHYSLFKGKELNDFVGTWIVGYPVWQDLRRYRPHHWRHHKYTNTDKDPDLDLAEAFPISKGSFFAQDASGCDGDFRIKKNLWSFAHGSWIHRV